MFVTDFVTRSHGGLGRTTHPEKQKKRNSVLDGCMKRKGFVAMRECVKIERLIPYILLEAIFDQLFICGRVTSQCM